MNTLTIAHSLINSGIERDHAEAIANALGNAFENQKEDLATKDFVDSKFQTLRAEISDLRGDMSTMDSSLRGSMSTMDSSLRGSMSTMDSSLHGSMSTMESSLRGSMSTMESSLRGSMSTMESSLRGDMKALETRLVRWIVLTAFSGMGILFAALRLFPG